MARIAMLKMAREQQPQQHNVAQAPITAFHAAVGQKKASKKGIVQLDSIGQSEFDSLVTEKGTVEDVIDWVQQLIDARNEM